MGCRKHSHQRPDGHPTEHDPLRTFSFGEMLIAWEARSMPNENDLPADVRAALDNNHEARKVFGGLSASHRREYLRWVLEAKKPETRARRVEGMMQRLTKAK
jgi:uncharacterized protein YdeI (YjbR/CyaY-like superfamily)